MSIYVTGGLEEDKIDADQAESELSDLLCEVLRFRRGLGKYDLSHLHGQERLNQNDDNWYELEYAIESALTKRGIKVAHSHKKL